VPRKAFKPSKCHPEKIDVSKGRCATCTVRDRRRTPEGKQSFRDSAKRYYSRNVEKCRKAGRENMYRAKYGLTGQQYKKLFDGAVCEICKSELRLVLDHNHSTGRLRGILCGFCNSGLGYFKDSISLLKSAIVYIEEV